MKLTELTTPPHVNGANSLPDLIEIKASDYQEPLIAALFGLPGSGKSRLIGTAPDPIGLIPLERKARQTVLDTAAEEGRIVIAPQIDLIRNENPVRLAALPFICVKTEGRKASAIQEEMQTIGSTISLAGAQPMCCQRHYFRWHVNRVKAVTFQMAAREDIRTIAIDTFGQFVEDVQYANYGTSGKIDASEFGFAPREDMHIEIRSFLHAIMHKHLILTHHAKEEWKNNLPSGNMIPDNKWNKLGHFCSVMIEMRTDKQAIAYNDMRRRGVRNDPMQPIWTLVVRDCQARPELIGQDLLQDSSINFLQLAMQVYPKSSPENWY